MKQILYLIVGRTGSGKSTIAEELSRRWNIPQVKSYTTRPMRPSEKEKSDHIFLQPEEVGKYTDDMAAYTKIGEYEYFVTWDYLKSLGDTIYVIDPAGVRYLKDTAKEKGLEKDFVIQTIYVTIDPEIQRKRLLLRGQTEKEIEERMAAEDKQFSEFEETIPFLPDILVISNNQKLNDAVEQIYNTAD